jgi:hypothetical protein
MLASLLGFVVKAIRPHVELVRDAKTAPSRLAGFLGSLSCRELTIPRLRSMMRKIMTQRVKMDFSRG